MHTNIIFCKRNLKIKIVYKSNVLKYHYFRIILKKGVKRKEYFKYESQTPRIRSV
jgi:hypothetical protein